MADFSSSIKNLFDSIRESLKRNIDSKANLKSYISSFQKEEDFNSWVFNNVALFVVAFAIMTAFFYTAFILIF
ncbi:MAG TPA: hypothetical protein QF468_10245 [Nitrospinota bacterium]|nr:hypothetical protein [Nitrospinota bacterium]